MAIHGKMNCVPTEISCTVHEIPRSLLPMALTLVQLLSGLAKQSSSGVSILFTVPSVCLCPGTLTWTINGMFS